MENDDHFPDLVINHYQPLSIISHYQLTIINRGHRATCWARWLTQGTQGPGDWSGMVMWEGTTNLLDPVRTFPKKLRLNSLLKFLLTRYSLEKIRSILSDAKKSFHPRWERPTLLPPKKHAGQQVPIFQPLISSMVWCRFSTRLRLANLLLPNLLVAKNFWVSWRPGSNQFIGTAERVWSQKHDVPNGQVQYNHGMYQLISGTLTRH